MTYRYVSHYYIEDGVSRYNSRCTLDFSDYHALESVDELINKLRKEPKLASGDVCTIVIDALKQLKSSVSSIQLIDPNIFHNIYIVSNSFPLLQLRNIPLLQELENLNSELDPNKQLDEDQKTKIKLGLISKESLWDRAVQNKMVNLVYCVKRDVSPLSSDYSNWYLMGSVFATTWILYWIFHSK